jgi:hypothetical protein
MRLRTAPDVPGGTMARTPDPPPVGPEFYEERWLVIVTVISAIFVGVTLLPRSLGTVLLGAFVLLVAPGFGLGAMLFGGPGRKFSRAANFAMVVGLSVLYNGVVGIILLLWGPGLNALILGLAALAPVCLGTLAQSRRRSTAPRFRLRNALAETLRFPGFSSAQRMVLWALLAGTLLVFAAIAYEASVVPAGSGGLSVALTGPDGTTDTLPGSGALNTSFSILLSVRSGDALPAALLTVSSVPVGSTTPPRFTVAWSMPLSLGPGVASSERVAISAGGSISVPVSFNFSQAGSYVVTFSISGTSAGSTVSATLSMMVR